MTPKRMLLVVLALLPFILALSWSDGDEAELLAHRIDRGSAHPCPGVRKAGEVCGIVNPRLNYWQLLPHPQGEGGLLIRASGAVTSYQQTSGPAGLLQETLPDEVKGLFLPPVVPRLALVVRACEGIGGRNCRSGNYVFVRNEVRIPHKDMWDSDHTEYVINNVNRVRNSNFGQGRETSDWFNYARGGFQVTVTRVSGWN